MIRPRPTIYHTAVRLDEQFLHTAGRIKRPLAHCAICGARLSQYRYPGETRCAPCIAKHTATLTVDELHPDRLAPDDPPPALPRRKDIGQCPDCGGVMYRQSQRCRRCYDQAKRRVGDAA